MKHEGSHYCLGGCGRLVSGNKLRCMHCIKEAAQATVEAKEGEPLEDTTHIIMQFESQNREDLYRADDGMLIACRQAEIVRFGTEPKEAANRLFLNAEFASKWLRRLAGFEIVSRKGNLTLASVIETAEPAEVKIEDRNAEHLISMPSGSPVTILKN